MQKRQFLKMFLYQINVVSPSLYWYIRVGPVCIKELWLFGAKMCLQYTRATPFRGARTLTAGFFVHDPVHQWLDIRFLLELLLMVQKSCAKTWDAGLTRRK